MGALESNGSSLQSSHAICPSSQTLSAAFIYNYVILYKTSLVRDVSSGHPYPNSSRTIIQPWNGRGIIVSPDGGAASHSPETTATVSPEGGAECNRGCVGYNAMDYLKLVAHVEIPVSSCLGIAGHVIIVAVEKVLDPGLYFEPFLNRRYGPDIHDAEG